jgi:hypothetical protein
VGGVEACGRRSPARLAAAGREGGTDQCKCWRRARWLAQVVGRHAGGPSSAVLPGSRDPAASEAWEGRVPRKRGARAGGVRRLGARGGGAGTGGAGGLLINGTVGRRDRASALRTEGSCWIGRQPRDRGPGPRLCWPQVRAHTERRRRHGGGAAWGGKCRAGRRLGRRPPAGAALGRQRAMPAHRLRAGCGAAATQRTAPARLFNRSGPWSCLCQGRGKPGPRHKHTSMLWGQCSI